MSRPSSSTCNNILNVSGWAFLNFIEEDHLIGSAANSFCQPHRPLHNRRIRVARQLVRATACFSMYSDISTLKSADSSSNRNSAKALQSSVLPTPVGPRNRKEPHWTVWDLGDLRVHVETALDTTPKASFLTNNASS